MRGELMKQLLAWRVSALGSRRSRHEGDPRPLSVDCPKAIGLRTNSIALGPTPVACASTLCRGSGKEPSLWRRNLMKFGQHDGFGGS